MQALPESRLVIEAIAPRPLRDSLALDSARRMSAENNISIIRHH
jgi:hypothetical protein